ncbi:MAG: GDP-mannose 4,6-dehydratase [Cellulomonadaceae bacterium]|nr:GDP-mannose 4,6-dehydratase [Cellulomonadaceae bacterium]
MTTAFITGITGQDGYYLAQRLISEGAAVHGLVQDMSEPGSDLLPAEVIKHVGDLTDPASITAAITAAAPDEIYNLGGISSVAFSWEHPTLTSQVSGVGAVAVMEAARGLQDSLGRPVRVLQASSAEIFGSATIIPQHENTPISPVSPYGAAKAFAHLAAKVFREEGLPVSTVILYNHESPMRPPTFVTRKITAGVAKIKHDGFGVITLGDLAPQRDWGWAPDYVDAMIKVIRHKEPSDFVIATGETHSVEELVEQAFARVGITDWRAHVVQDTAFIRPVDTRLQVGDASKAREVLGWEPSLSFADIVNQMVDHDIALLAN